MLSPQSSAREWGTNFLADVPLQWRGFYVCTVVQGDAPSERFRRDLSSFNIAVPFIVPSWLWGKNGQGTSFSPMGGGVTPKGLYTAVHDGCTGQLACVFAAIAPGPRVPCFRFLDASSRLINSRESAAFFRRSSCSSLLRAAWFWRAESRCRREGRGGSGYVSRVHGCASHPVRRDLHDETTSDFFKLFVYRGVSLF